MTPIRQPHLRQHSNAKLFGIAFARARPCYCYGCICLTADERATERRIFRLARAWGKAVRAQRRERPIITM